MTQMICIRCPKGCHLEIGKNNTVGGNECPRGVEYALKELLNPTRTLTSTVRVTGSPFRRLPVKTSGEIPKSLVLDAARALDEITVEAPIQAEQTILADILGTGVSVVATRRIPLLFHSWTNNDKMPYTLLLHFE